MQSQLEEAYFGERLGNKWLYQISAQQFQLECLSTNLTAGDSTGLRAYSGSHVAIRLLSAYPFLLKDKNIAELGCGIGVFGLVGTHLSEPSLLVLTDGEARGSSIVEKNIEHTNHESKAHYLPRVPTYYQQLKWGDADGIHAMLSLCKLSLKPSKHFDIVLGCELMYFNTDVELLIQTVHSLTDSKGLFIHSHLFRAHHQEQQLIDILSAHNWTTLEIPHKEFISAEELGHHVEWYRVRPLISGPVDIIARLAEEHPSWREFKEEITYDDEEEDPSSQEEGLITNLFA